MLSAFSHLILFAIILVRYHLHTINIMCLSEEFDDINVTELCISLFSFRSAEDALWPFVLKPFPPQAPQPQATIDLLYASVGGVASYKCGQIWPAACLCKLLYRNAAMPLH